VSPPRDKARGFPFPEDACPAPAGTGLCHVRTCHVLWWYVETPHRPAAAGLVLGQTCVTADLIWFIYNPKLILLSPASHRQKSG